ncbi:Dmd discriminator of mRNA degradation [Yersinia phage vB_YenM_P8]
MEEFAKVVFIGWFENGSMFTKEIRMDITDKEHIMWATMQFAEINKALVKAFVNDVKVFECDWRSKPEEI